VLLTAQALQEAADAHQSQMAAAVDAHERELQVRSTPEPYFYTAPADEIRSLDSLRSSGTQPRWSGRLRRCSSWTLNFIIGATP
jgi:hypothetical protein